MNQIDNQITSAVKAIKTAILEGQYEAAKGVNRIQLAVYYGVGRYLSQHTRVGVWGTDALKTISERLQKELPGLRGFSASQLKNMRKFYDEWQKIDAKSTITIADLKECNSTIAIAESQMVDEQVDINSVIAITGFKDFPIEDFFRVPFTHHLRILETVKTLPERCYYIHRTSEEYLTVETLKKLMKEDAFHHQGNLPNNFGRTLSNATQAHRAVMMFKDEYLLNFINVEQIGERDAEDVDERVVEQQIVQNIKNFIMTFGRDFAFVGNQYHLEVYGVDHFPDLLFFNRELNCLVCVELKTGTFKSGYLGQLMSYLTILDDKVRKPHENPSIGIVLCKSAQKDYVEYIIRDYNKPMGVATYTTSEEMPERLRRTLPDMDELKKLL